MNALYTEPVITKDRCYYTVDMGLGLYGGIIKDEIGYVIYTDEHEPEDLLFQDYIVFHKTLKAAKAEIIDFLESYRDCLYADE